MANGERPKWFKYYKLLTSGEGENQCPVEEFTLPDWNEDYGDGKFVWDWLLQDYHKSICWLKEYVEQIDNKAGVLVAARYKPPKIQTKYSYGYAWDGGKQAYKFNDDTSASITIDFSNYETVREYIDERRTNAEIAIEEGKARLPDYDETQAYTIIEHEVRTAKKVVEVPTEVWTGTQWETQTVPREVEVPVTHQEPYTWEETVCKTVESVLVAWPNSEDITKGSDVEWRPGCKTWCKNTVILAQTFKAPYDTTIKKVYLGVKRPKNGNKRLYVGLAKVKTGGTPDITITDHKCPGLKVTGFLELKNDQDAVAVQGSDIMVFPFSVPVKKDNYYAIVIYTEETQSEKGWRILGIRKDFDKGKSWMYWNQYAGWQKLAGTRNGKAVTGSICFKIECIDTKCTTEIRKAVKEWTEYVHQVVYDEVQVGYPQIDIVYVPVEVEYTYDYYYPVTAYQTVKKYKTDKYIYTRPIKLNPVTMVQLEASDSRPTGTNIKYEVSPNGLSWYELNASNNYTVSFTEPAEVVILRAYLETTDDTVTPSISSLKLNLTMEPAPEMYVVSEAYYPPVAKILGASLWNSVDVDYELQEGVTASVDVIKNETVTYQHTIDGNTSLELPVRRVLEGSVYLSLQDNTTGDITPLYEYDDYAIDYETATITFYKSFTGTVHVEYKPVLTAGLKHEDNSLPPALDSHMETFTGDGETTTFTLTFPPAEPIHLVQINEENKEEGIDYTVDYAKGTVTFAEAPVQNANIEVYYTPNIDDESLMLAVKMTRDTSARQGYVKEFKFIYRV